MIADYYRQIVKEANAKMSAAEVILNDPGTWGAIGMGRPSWRRCLFEAHEDLLKIRGNVSGAIRVEAAPFLCGPRVATVAPADGP
jgi:hypothetical protein